MAGVVKAKLPGGACMVLMPEYNPRQFLINLSQFRCTHATGVPTIYTLAMRETDLMETLDFSALRSLTVGSAPVHYKVRRGMEQSFKCPVTESYGLTEGGPVMFGPPTDNRPVPSGSCGVLWPGCEAKLVTASGDTAQKGELWVRNPGLMTGYHNLSAVTASRMRDGWLMTGDLFEVDADGFWYFCGRTDDMFVCGGENIFLKEAEDLLLTHPVVLEACVVPAEYAAKGEAPVALVVASPNLTVDEAGLKEFCIQHGPACAHPRRIIFTDVLPLNGAGKVDRGRVAKELRNILSAAPSA
jgi:acyl-CoA synthetase (AMP-forming)/AMP-acid ligase II